eukprot:scpid56601/ scgid30974/ 
MTVANGVRSLHATTEQRARDNIRDAEARLAISCQSRASVDLLVLDSRSTSRSQLIRVCSPVSMWSCRSLAPATASVEPAQCGLLALLNLYSVSTLCATHCCLTAG